MKRNSRTPDPALTDRELVRRVLENPSSNFNLLDGQFRAKIYRFSLIHAMNHGLAEDLTQETLLKAFQKLHTFRFESKLYTWLCAIARNEFRMWTRHESNWPTISLDTDKDKKVELSDEETIFRRVEDEPGIDVARRDPVVEGLPARLFLQRFIPRLPEKQRQAFILYTLEGYGHLEVAARLCCTIPTSKSQLHRARLKLAKAEAVSRGIHPKKLRGCTLESVQAQIRGASAPKPRAMAARA